jgi:DNA-binding NarL/FixJ family response regulator
VLGQLFAYPFAGGALFALIWMFRRYEAQIGTTLSAIRAGGGRVPQALRARLLAAGPLARTLPARARTAPIHLTDAEIYVVEALASGLEPGEIAHGSARSGRTVQNHLARAKKKTGARTLAQLASLSEHPDWPSLRIDD